LNNASSQCTTYITPGSAAGIALGVVGTVAGIAAIVVVFIKTSASTATAGMTKVPNTA